MASPLFVKLDEIDFNTVEYPIEEVQKYIPQRHEMEQIHGVFKLWREEGRGVGWRDIRGDEFWCRGHIPGRPIFPGVLMIEAAAQLCTFVYKMYSGDEPGRFIGFGGLDKTKFRGQVKPGDRLILMCKVVEARSRRFIFDSQGAVNGQLVFEATITGLPV